MVKVSNEFLVTTENRFFFLRTLIKIRNSEDFKKFPDILVLPAYNIYVVVKFLN